MFGKSHHSRILVAWLAQVVLICACLNCGAGEDGQLRVAFCPFKLNRTLVNSCGEDISKANRLEGILAFEDVVETKLLAETGVHWIERREVEKTIREMTINLSQNGGDSVLQVGRWVKADLLIDGRFERAGELTRQLNVQVVDAVTADVIASKVFKIAGSAFAPVEPRDSEIETAANYLRDVVKKAIVDVPATRKKGRIAFLYLRNTTPGGQRRLDIENMLIEGVRKQALSGKDMRVLNLLGSESLLEEQGLALLGLVAGDAEARKRVADTFVWGNYWEADDGPHGTNSLDVGVKLAVWNVGEKAVELEGRTGPERLPQLLKQVIQSTVTQSDGDKRNQWSDDEALNVALMQIKMASETCLAGRPGGVSDWNGKEYEYAWWATLRMLESVCFLAPNSEYAHRAMIKHKWTDKWFGCAWYPFTDFRTRRSADWKEHVARFGLETRTPIYGSADRMTLGATNSAWRIGDCAGDYIKSCREEYEWGPGIRTPCSSPEAVASELADRLELVQRNHKGSLEPMMGVLHVMCWKGSEREIGDPNVRERLIRAVWPTVSAAWFVPEGEEKDIKQIIRQNYKDSGKIEEGEKLLESFKPATTARAGDSDKLQLPEFPVVTPLPVRIAPELTRVDGITNAKALSWDGGKLWAADREGRIVAVGDDPGKDKGLSVSDVSKSLMMQTNTAFVQVRSNFFSHSLQWDRNAWRADGRLQADGSVNAVVIDSPRVWMGGPSGLLRYTPDTGEAKAWFVTSRWVDDSTLTWVRKNMERCAAVSRELGRNVSILDPRTRLAGEISSMASGGGMLWIAVSNLSARLAGGQGDAYVFVLHKDSEKWAGYFEAPGRISGMAASDKCVWMICAGSNDCVYRVDIDDVLRLSPRDKWMSDEIAPEEIAAAEAKLSPQLQGIRAFFSGNYGKAIELLDHGEERYRMDAYALVLLMYAYTDGLDDELGAWQYTYDLGLRQRAGLLDRKETAWFFPMKVGWNDHTW
jgi:hypothetical protein